ncbi:unnamed protein product [Angiostrongylus costaricensis]|uniref:Transmembrane protein n=1 Tax=Angiostrongylus costaricensis TaxID=334426 RepID=A0A0R3Q2Q6_ANGCS|nr:unnamed protein product [Angiostrongylus costaricensis]
MAGLLGVSHGRNWIWTQRMRAALQPRDPHRSVIVVAQRFAFFLTVFLGMLFRIVILLELRRATSLADCHSGGTTIRVLLDRFPRNAFSDRDPPRVAESNIFGRL